MAERTLDPVVVIESRGEESVTYFDPPSGYRWVIRGICNQCGSCERDSTDDFIVWVGLPGTPGACIDTRVPRLDNPVRPEGPPTWPGCSLTGEYL